MCASGKLGNKRNCLSNTTLVNFAAKGFAERMLSDEGREGISSFIEKRKPVWTK